MYSGWPAYHASFSATNGESSASIAKPMRMRSHRSLAGSGTSYGCSNGEGSDGGGRREGGEAGKAGQAKARPRRSASGSDRRLNSIPLVLVSSRLSDGTTPNPRAPPPHPDRA